MITHFAFIDSLDFVLIGSINLFDISRKDFIIYIKQKYRCLVNISYLLQLYKYIKFQRYAFIIAKPIFWRLDRCPKCQRKDIVKMHLQINCNSCGYSYLKKNCPKCGSSLANLDYSKRDIGQWVGCFSCQLCGATHTDVIYV
jgi:hypothetical protein